MVPKVKRYKIVPKTVTEKIQDGSKLKRYKMVPKTVTERIQDGSKNIQ